MNLYTVMLAANPHGFWGSMKESVLTWINSGVDEFIIPLAIVLLAIAAIICLIAAGLKWNNRQSQEFQNLLIGFVICAIIITILLTKNIWWTFLTGGVG